GLQRLVPPQPPFAPVDLGLGGESGALLAPGVRADAFEGRLERHRHGLTANLEFTCEAEAIAFLLVRPLYTRASERDLRVILDVEEVRGAQVRIPVRHAGVDAGGIDLHDDAGLVRVVLVDLDRPGKRLEATANGRE